MFQLDSVFFRFITNLGSIIIVSILWAICCIPIITIVPSTAALYYTCVKVIRHDRGYLFLEFFHSFRSNLKQGVFITLLALLFGWLLYVDYNYITTLNPVPYYLTAVYRTALIFYVCLLIYITLNLSRFSMSIIGLLKLSLFMMIRHFYLSFIMLVLVVATGILIRAIPVTLLILPGIYILLTSLVMEKILKKYMPQIKENANHWYYDE